MNYSLELLQCFSYH